MGYVFTSTLKPQTWALMQTVEFRAVLASASAAREATRDFIAPFPMPNADALVVVSELVTNAVRHGAEPIALLLTWDGRTLRIEVSDGDPRVDGVKAVAPSAATDHGRGLVITDHLAESWGARAGPRGLGKTVWATIASEVLSDPDQATGLVDGPT